jgi:flagellum-specific peptidoglycan hydrolase FlgJ/LysM repeat protein
MSVVSHGNGNIAPNAGLPEGMDPQNIAEVVGALMGQPAMLAMLANGDLELQITNNSVSVVPARKQPGQTPPVAAPHMGPVVREAATIQEAVLTEPVTHTPKTPPETPPVRKAPQQPVDGATIPNVSAEPVVTDRHESQSVPVSQAKANAPDQSASQPATTSVASEQDIVTPATTIRTPLEDQATEHIEEVLSDTPLPPSTVKQPPREPVNVTPKPTVKPRDSAADYRPISFTGAKPEEALPKGFIVINPADRRRDTIRALAAGATAAGAIIATYGSMSTGTVGVDAAEAAGPGLQQVGNTQIITGDGRQDDGIVERLRATVNRLGLKDGRDASDVAERLSQERGYKITTRELLEANPTITDSQTGQQYKVEAKNPDRDIDARLPVGHLEIKVPAPVAKGQAITEPGDTVNSIAQQMNKPVAEVRKLNPHLPEKDNVFIPNETMIWTEPQPDPSMVLQVATEATDKEVKILLSADEATRKKLLEANPGGKLEDGVQPGEEVYIPLRQTPQMKQADIKPEEIIAANKPAFTDPAAPRVPQAEAAAQKPATDSAAAKPEAKPEAQAETKPTTVGEKQAPTTKLTAEQAAAEQDKIIDHLNIGAAQKATLKRLVHGITPLQSSAEAKGINMSVMTAQGILESGWGESTLASKHNNWFGNKANDGWKGRSVTVQTGEHINGRDETIPDAFRSYDSLEDGFNDYIEKMVGKSFYEDALRYPTDARMFVTGLVNSLGKDGSIVGKQGSKGVSSYATDPKYVSKIMQLVDKLHLTDIYDASRTQPVSSSGYVVPGKKKEQTPEVKQTGTTKKVIGKGEQTFDVVLPGTSDTLNPDDYSSIQNPLPKVKEGWALIDADDNKATGLHGKEKKSRDIGAQERRNIITREISQVQSSKERYEAFMANKYIDCREEVRSKYQYFRGDPKPRGNGLGKPKKNSDIKGLVIHFTATQSKVNNMDGMRFASSVHNAGNHLGMQYFLNDEGTGYRLTDDFTNHALTHNGIRHNGKWFGIEIAASEQGEINNEQYESLVYIMADFLISHDFVQPGVSIDSAVTTMIKGHREANPGHGYHHDFPGIVMDRVRGELISFMVQDMGYTSKMMK